jgi:CRISPR type IV-associated protein Csf2
MQTIVYEGTVTALSSIAHSGGVSLGISTKLRREKFVQPDGTVEEVPVVSGNGVRGRLRDLGMLHMCRALGYGIEEATGEVLRLSLPAFYFLFSGGTLTSEGGKGLDLQGMRQLRTLIPLVSIFGGAFGNAILPGRIKIGKLIPLCTETAHLVPERFAALPVCQQSIWEYLQEEMYTRKDDAKNEHYQPLLQAAVQGLLTQKAEGRRQRQDAGTDIAERPGTAQQLMYHVETFAPGTQFHWKLVVDDLSPLEMDAWLTTLNEFSKSPYVGGKSGVGLGEVAVRFDRWLQIDSRVQGQGTEVGLVLGRQYAEHLAAQGDAIRELLDILH